MFQKDVSLDYKSKFRKALEKFLDKNDMLLIITEEADYTTSVVIDWLLFNNIKFIRINQTDELEIYFLKDDIELKAKNYSFLLSEITSYWYRRGSLNIKFNKTTDKKINNFINLEVSKCLQYLYFKLSKLHHLNLYQNAVVNKLIVSGIAREIGFTTPNDYLINTKEELFKIKGYKNHISKTITGSTMINLGEYTLVGNTKFLDCKNKITNNFFPSLVQNYIEKRYELRIFYLDGCTYSMAIFSQNDETTKVDFRNYNKNNPNRTIPFNLPTVIEKKIDKLMKKLNLNSGSIDMIVTPDLEFVFLEVNPVGQFGMVSYPCNYRLHEKIVSFFDNII
ncbi:Protein of unknown function [Flavobacterium indicum GPTSA100-9 = DSM 17447]|uniref:Grasp-with-spasm system ATP-grasp peptide maturase n=1 Tax=Flavobacterium indicum (strain DSM 17447 / CIP 109464 / GPTSA100-9) TaxID=1094466 RepID=H8XNT4_FLAIG|nr:grasp-with-spasm system ATP-grasp peptide maturase [Flavobacterium indicum]CCG52201.1 Protein of unknown function [Flavobacterium indicum GPTSA100-9 = DSM 17447]